MRRRRGKALPPLTAAQQQLLAEHAGMAVAAAVGYVREHPGWEHVLDELEGAAMDGLAAAASRFDPVRGTKFVTFAWWRVQGAIVDFLRSIRAGSHRSKTAVPPLRYDAVKHDRRCDLRTPEMLAAARQELARISEVDPDKLVFLQALAGGDTLEEAGARIGITKSWACRLRAQLIDEMTAC